MLYYSKRLSNRFSTAILSFCNQANAKLKIPDVSAWYARLMADPSFVEKVRARWQVKPAML